jgi:TRAP transporter TAXI family solute receptor
MSGDEGPPRGRGLSRRWFLGLGAAGIVGGAAGFLLTRGEEELQLPSGLILAGGVKGATYLQVGTDLAAAIESLAPETTVEVRVTGASVANLKLLNSGEADIGFSALDAAAVDQGVLNRRITGISRIYESYVQLMVPADSEIDSLADLEGKRVSVGASNSGTEFTTTLMLKTAGITLGVQENMGQNPASAALKEGTLDAAFSATGLPTPSIERLAQEMPLRLVSIGAYYPMLERAIPHVYAYASIPAGTYTNTAETSTIAIPNALLAREGLPEDVVTLVTKAVLSDSSTVFWEHAVTKNISRAQAGKLGTVEMNPVAKSWLDAY